jgi:hypothetical protein
MAKPFTITGNVFKYPGAGGWHFIGVPKKESAKIKASDATRVGWGFVRVRAKVGESAWETTFFPTKTGEYLLSINVKVRKREDIFDGDTITVACELL